MKQENEELAQDECKTFLLAIPNDFGIYKVFNKNLESLGFKVIDLVPQAFKYSSFVQRIINFFYKLIYNSRNYKRNLIKKFNSQKVIEKIGHLSKDSIDYVLIIRPDVLEIATLKKMLTIGKKVVAYQWDGLDRYEKVFSTIPLFDQFLVFDQNDFDHYSSQFQNLKKCENFYFDVDDNSKNVSDSDIVYYVGSYIPERSEEVLQVIRLLEDLDLTLDINLKYHSDNLPIKHPHIKFFSSNFEYSDNIAQLKKSKILLDFKVPEHSGLSLRFFEALKYRKKIITNNASVLKYEFYHPQNIFVLDYDNEERLGEFVSSDYYEINPDVVNYYSFSSWLQRNVL